MRDGEGALDLVEAAAEPRGRGGIAVAMTIDGGTGTGQPVGPAEELRRDEDAAGLGGRLRRPLVVLHSLRPPDGTTKYVDQIVEGAPPDVHVRFFTWWTALFGRYDVLHVHWPELLVRDSRGVVARMLKRRLLDVLLLRLRWKRIPLVWTAHNLSPHEAGSAAERRALARLTRRIDLVIRLNEASPAAGGEVRLIPHGHYRDAFAPHPKPEAEPGRILYFGLIRQYKGVEQLFEAFEKLDRSDVRLRIVGQPHPGQAERVLEACARDPRISSVLRFVDDAELVDEICRAQLVVLPYRGFMHNSGSLLAGLSLGRPVLVPASPTNEALAKEVGPGWVLQHPGDLTSEVLETALDAVAGRPAEPPRLDGRDWPEVGRRHRDAYLRALAGRRGP